MGDDSDDPAAPEGGDGSVEGGPANDDAPPSTPPGTDEPAESATRPRSDTDFRGVTLDDDRDEDAFWATYGRRQRSERHQNADRLLTANEAHLDAIDDISRSDLREHYGIVRTALKRREGLYDSFQRQLTRAWIPETYDQYLARTVARAFLLTAAVVVVGVAVAIGLFGLDRYGTLPAAVRGLGPSPGFLAAAVAGGSVLLGVAAGAGYWAWWRIVHVRSRIAHRRREINYNLPYAVTFMYALAQADVSFEQIILRLADSTDTYGAVGQEFDRVVRDVEMFGNNLYTGLSNLRGITPSTPLQRFTDDLLTVLETGGDLAAYLRDEVDTQLETAVAEQEAFIEQLELLSEVFVVGFVAAPLFILVVLIVVSFLGAQTTTIIALLVYVVIPLALVGFALLIDAVSQPFRSPPVSFTPSAAAPEATAADADAPEWWASYERDRRLSGLRNRLRDQALRARDEPWRVLVLSVPLALAIPVVGVFTGMVPLRLSAMLAAPVDLTTGLVVAPLVVATAPVAVAYEYRHRREAALKRRFPDLLGLLATSNRRGLPLTRALDIVAESTSGRLGEELRLLRNDIVWNADLPEAFESFGDRLGSPTLNRTVNLIAEGSRATSDLHVVLGIAATDTEERVRLERERRQTLQSYLVIVVIGFLVYLLVVLLLASNFLDPIEAFGATAVPDEAGPVSLAAVPVEQIRVVLFHSALIQGFGSGLLAGKLAENSIYSGLKYGLALVILAVAAFMVV